MSAGTAIINAAPIFWLDGEWVMQALSHIFFGLSHERKKYLMFFIKFFTGLLVCNFVLGVVVIFATYL